ncbi:MAG: hypothetical protein JNL60_01795 [Bacteroidia bacterium]|nr:hypothetical protein [Bacteroidia bacterium]
MTKYFKTIILLVLTVCCMPSAMLSQTSPEAPKTTGSGKAEEDEFAKKKPETKITEVIPTDSIAPGELQKRATNWMKEEHDKYKISGAATTSNKAECIVSFPVKPKELNPQVDYTGKVTMKVVVEFKDSKYRYTISEIQHISKSGKTTAGSVDNVVPDCGSMAMDDLCWKRLKGEAMRYAGLVVIDLKSAMSKIESDVKTDEW